MSFILYGGYWIFFGQKIFAFFKTDETPLTLMTFAIHYVFNDYKDILIYALLVYIGLTLFMMRPTQIWYAPFLLEHIFLGNHLMILTVALVTAFQKSQQILLLKVLPLIGMIIIFGMAFDFENKVNGHMLIIFIGVILQSIG